MAKKSKQILYLRLSSVMQIFKELFIHGIDSFGVPPPPGMLEQNPSLVIDKCKTEK